MAKVTIDGQVIEVPSGSTVLQACEAAGREIPRFCYHERLSIAGNCRMCLVEVERAPKPVASCGFPVADGMVVRTDSKMVRDARRAVMEFLLINHPLDCPICDQGGECDLQDQAYGYGMDHSRYAENKRAVKDKYLGPLVKTVMTRCIQCTRCVRFATEVAGVPELGATSRGENMEIGTYVERALTSELSGCMIDICPVGALTSKPYAFVARPWELAKTDSIDVTDATGTNIRVDARAGEVLRVLPRTNDEVNEEWMGDKGRFSFDGLRRRRLDRPWVRRGGKLQAASWSEAFDLIAGRIKAVRPDRVGAIAGDLCDAESMTALRDLMGAIGSTNLDCRQDGAALNASRRDFYLFNTTIVGIEESDGLLLVGCNTRRLSPVINARIRKRATQGNFPIIAIGDAGVDQTYPVTILGDETELLSRLFEDHGILAGCKRPMIIVGEAALAREDGAAILSACWRLAEAIGALSPEWHGFNVLHSAAARVGGLDLGLLPGPGGRTARGMMSGGVDVLWLLGADEFDMSLIGPETFVVYQGSHGDAGAARADVILPGATWVEKEGTYVNTEGRSQIAFRASFPPGEAREDWRILRAMSDVLGCPLPYDDLVGVRARMVAINQVFAREHLPRFGVSDRTGPAAGTVGSAPIRASDFDYYQTNPISRASVTMQSCTAVIGSPFGGPPLADAAE